MRCAKCGGNTFGSSEQPDGSWRRYCHGRDEEGCPYGHTWLESDDYLNDINARYLLKVRGESYIFGFMYIAEKGGARISDVQWTSRADDAFRFDSREIAEFFGELIKPPVAPQYLRTFDLEPVPSPDHGVRYGTLSRPKPDKV